MCLFVIPASASSVSLFRDVNSDSSISNRLIDIYRNQSDYDPQQDYVVYSSDQYSYTLAYGDLENSYNYIRFTQAHNYFPASYSFGSASQLSIVDNGYAYVGNVPGSQRSDRADSYAFRFLLVIAVSFLLLLTIFKIHKRVNMSPSKGFDIR